MTDAHNDAPVKKNPPAKNETLLLDLPNAAAVVGLTVWQLRGLIANRQLPIVKVGRRF
jgi:hypothetical protein